MKARTRDWKGKTNIGACTLKGYLHMCVIHTKSYQRFPEVSHHIYTILIFIKFIQNKLQYLTVFQIAETYSFRHLNKIFKSLVVHISFICYSTHVPRLNGPRLPQLSTFSVSSILYQLLLLDAICRPLQLLSRCLTSQNSV